MIAESADKGYGNLAKKTVDRQSAATSKPSQATQTSEFNARFVPIVVFRVKSRFAVDHGWDGQ